MQDGSYLGIKASAGSVENKRDKEVVEKKKEKHKAKSKKQFTLGKLGGWKLGGSCSSAKVQKCGVGNAGRATN